MGVPKPAPSSVTVSLPKLLLSAGSRHQVTDGIPPEVLGLPVTYRSASGIVLVGDDVLMVPRCDGRTLGLPRAEIQEGEAAEDAISRRMAEVLGSEPSRVTLAAEAWTVRGAEVSVSKAFLCDMPEAGAPSSAESEMRWVPLRDVTESPSFPGEDGPVLKVLFPYG